MGLETWVSLAAIVGVGATVLTVLLGAIHRAEIRLEGRMDRFGDRMRSLDSRIDEVRAKLSAEKVSKSSFGFLRRETEGLRGEVNLLRADITALAIARSTNETLYDSLVTRVADMDASLRVIDARIFELATKRSAPELIVPTSTH